MYHDPRQSKHYSMYDCYSSIPIFQLQFGDENYITIYSSVVCYVRYVLPINLSFPISL